MKYEKKSGLAHEADSLFSDLKNFLQAEGLQKIRLFNRYDVEGVDEALFARCRQTVFSEPQLDDVLETLPEDADAIFAVEYLPGQFDQRADSAAQCIQILARMDRPTIRTAKVYLLYGSITADTLEKIKQYVINPVETREASLSL